MCARLPLRPFLTGMTLGLVGLSLFSLVGEGAAIAQEPPPMPILYGGRVLINGDPALPGTEIVARVGDYHVSTVVEVGEEGSYRNLLVAPSSSDYYDMPVTFHALDTTALEEDIFKRSGGVVFKTTGDAAFDLHFQISPEAGPENIGTTTELEMRPAGGQASESPVAVELESRNRGVLLVALGVVATVGLAVAIGLWAFLRMSR